MARLSLEEILQATGGIQVGGRGNPIFASYSIDSRTLARNDLFVAIVGPNHDGHAFIPEAVRKGSGGLIVSREVSAELRGEVPTVRVGDTHTALKDLATHVRERSPLRVIGVTGSAGKTTTKEMAHLVLSGQFTSYASPGNLNNLYGLPLALLRMPEGTDTAVLEMGMSSSGELRRIARIARPDVGCLTNILAVHLKFFDSLEGIAAAKAELFEELSPESLAIWNLDDPKVAAIGRRFPGRSITFGLGSAADWTATAIRDRGLAGTSFRLQGGNGSMDVNLAAPGRHNLRNSLAAAAIGDACGVPLDRIAAGLEAFRPVRMRGESRTLPNGARVIDECYNSNPQAMEEVLAWFSGLTTPGRRIVASGDMLELGMQERRAHQALGERIAEVAPDLFIGVGPLHREAIEAARAAGLADSRHFASASAAGDFLAGWIRDGDLLLVKGSRGLQMEIIIQRLERKGRSGG